jgi:hypothetical protein
MARRQAEAGTPVGATCRTLGVSEQSFQPHPRTDL